jgi:uncharacterized repeat protein (TIGR03803 family)
MKRNNIQAVLAMALLGFTSVAFAQTPNLIYSFDAVGEGIYGPFPNSVMAEGRDGNLYGTSYSGGTNTFGGIFVITPSGSESVLHNFTATEGQHCNMGLTLGNDGNFYGTCFDGGTGNAGTVYRITPGGVFTILHNFTNTGTDGAEPNAPPIQAADGNFYGTTEIGGASHDGTIYKLTPAGKFTTIHSFVFPGEGGSPSSQLIQASNGVLYGTTLEGSASGTVFKVTTAGKLTVLHNFAAADGQLPEGGLIQGTDGNFYGTTNLGGANGEGTVYKITAAGKFSVLESFNASVDGQGEPWVGLTQASDGNYYGITFRMGLFEKPQDGGIYEINAKGVYSSLYLFDGMVGADPASALIQHTNGLLYGNTQNAGGFNVGTVYSLNVGAPAFCIVQGKSGKIGSTVGIIGQGFNSSSIVKFGGVVATSLAPTGATFITATVPANALTGTISVTTGSSALTSRQMFKITPTLKTFSPASGPVGTSVTITGTGLTQTTKVKFDGIAASFIVNSDTQITTVVPAGAATGKIALTTLGGSATSATMFAVP